MGFWGTLGKIGSIAANVVPAIFTGGASLPATAAMTGIGKAANIAGKIASAGGPILTGLATGAQKGREAENSAASDAANFALRESGQHEGQLMDRAGLDIKQRGFTQDSEDRAYKNALQSALAKNMSDVKLNLPSRIPKFTFSGGSRPSAIGPEGKAAADLMHQKAMTSLMNGEKFDALPALERTAAPTYKKPGFWENTAGIGATVMNGINGAGAAAQQQTFQDKILKAIQDLSQKPGAAGVAGPTDPRLAGVTPFVKPPMAKLLRIPSVNPDDDGQ